LHDFLFRLAASFEVAIHSDVPAFHNNSHNRTSWSSLVSILKSMSRVGTALPARVKGPQNLAPHMRSPAFIRGKILA
jgi:hypothetical protein